MAMDFWAAQRRARALTTLYIILFVIMTLIMSTFVEFGMRNFVEDYATTPFPWMGMGFAMLTILVAGFQYLRFKAGGGKVVAESLGAKLVSPDTQNLKERQLLNIVQEIALATSLPVPPVYILPANEINAFAAGLSPEDAVVTVTVGTLNLLNRDELQGVVAHEFGHVYNGDMTISMRLAALVMGFFFILYMGLRIMQFTSFRSRSDNGKQGANPIMIAAILFVIAGTCTYAFGSLLKLAVSRQREYLADACAVQFTRNPEGIANALRKIERSQTSDMPSQGAAYSHLYFNDHSAFSTLFQTHPPLEKRIAAILGTKIVNDEQ